MKYLGLLLIFVAGLTRVHAQDHILQRSVDVHFDGLHPEQALQLLEEQLGVRFVYASSLFRDKRRKISMVAKGRTLEAILREICKGSSIKLIARGQRIHIIRDNKKTSKFQFNGYIRDQTSGEALVGASLIIQNLPHTGTYTNDYGFYSLTLPEAKYLVRISYLGYISKTIKLNLNRNCRNDLSLLPDTSWLPEITIHANNDEERIWNKRSGYHQIQLQQLKTLPSLGGEADALKMAQYLPGVKSAGEGSAGIYVRGGNIDQNLILLDGAPVYNPTHLLGFFSAFNTDALHHSALYKADFPIEYGGRLSSVLDLKMREGNREKTSLEGGIGLLASRILIEGPIKQKKSSFMLSARRTYPDLALGFSKDNGGNKAHFYDVNGKVNFSLNPNNQLYFSTYLGRDVFRFFDKFENTWGNATASLRWNHVINSRLFSKFSLIYSRYQYFIDNILEGQQTFNWQTGINDLNGRADFGAYITPQHTIKFGINSTFHRINPGRETRNLIRSVPESRALETTFYVGHNWHINDYLKADYGLRLNLYQNLGKGTLFSFQDTPPYIDSTQTRGVYHTFLHPTLRFSLRYKVNPKTVVKAAFSQTVQYQQELRNSVSPFSSFYIWFASNPNIPAQRADQLSLGYYQKLGHKGITASVELYHKWLYNQIDFADHALLLQNPYLEREIRVGKGRAYGIEFMLEKTGGRFSGWINYTYSRSLRTIDGINGGMSYPAYFDLPHEAGIILQYAHSARWEFSVNWQYTTGKAVNLPTGSFQFNQAIVPLYEGRNSSRLPDFHRLDLSATFDTKKRKAQRWNAYWVFALQNVYYRKNALSIDLLPYKDLWSGIQDPDAISAYKTYIFGLVPSVSYNFKF